MRVIAGQYRHRKLLAPPGCQTRPILDRVKVSLFDWLGARLAMPGLLPPIHVLDLFCGGGSLGIEALSRGAISCVFVDADKDAVEALRKNLDSLKIGPCGVICPVRAEAGQITPAGGSGFDLIFLDPPYLLSEDLSTGSVIDLVLERLGRDLPVPKSALLIWRHASSVTLPTEVGHGWTRFTRRESGDMAITVYQRRNEGSP